MRILFFALLMLNASLLGSLVDRAKQVYVYNCQHELGPLWVDDGLAIPISNPFLPNADGSYRFYSDSHCAAVEVR